MPAAEPLRLLDALAAATRGARFDQLPGLIAALEASLAQPGTRPGTAAERARIRQRITENRRLLAAASDGLGTAHRRIAELTENLSTLRTYDSLGRRQAVRAGREGFERKA